MNHAYKARGLFEEAQGITRKAISESRGLTADERANVDRLMAEGNAVLGMASADRIRGEMGGPGGDASEVIDAIVKSVQGVNRASSQWSTGALEFGNVGGKATLTTGGAGGITGGGLDQPDLQPGIIDILVQQPTVAALAGSAQASSAQVKYLVESVATNAADAVVESGTAPESTFEFSDATQDILRIATALPVTDDILDDVPGLQSYLTGRLGQFVAQELDDTLLNGDNSGELDGYLHVVANQSPSGNRAVTSDAADAQAADHVYAAITAVQVNGFVEPDAIVMNPLDYEGVRLLKDSQGRYLTGQPADAGTRQLWGLPVILTQNIAQGTVLVGAFKSCSTVHYRGGLTVEVSNSHSDFFARFKTEMRASVRVALAVTRPAGFATADVSGS